MTHVNSLIVVADRGSLRAYRVEPLPERAPRLAVLQQMDLTVARGRVQDGLTDAAGRFGARTGAGAPGAAGAAGTADHGTLELENERRAVKQLAEAIATVCQQEEPAGWSLAAPKQILHSLVEQLPKPWRDRLIEQVGQDLAKVPPGELPGHFESLQRDPRRSA